MEHSIPDDGPTTDDAMTRSEEEHEVVLHEEEVVIEKRAVPKERVRMDTSITRGS